jgi:hypothetical protein
MAQLQRAEPGALLLLADMGSPSLALCYCLICFTIRQAGMILGSRPAVPVWHFVIA